MILKYLFGSLNPNKYHRLHEVSHTRLVLLTVLTALICAAAFFILLLPAVFQADDAVQELRATTNITLSGAMTQTKPTYLTHNPDILVTTGEGDAFITITPNSIAIKRFVYFGEKTYLWEQLRTLKTIPLADIIASLALFLLPSLLIWGTLAMLITAAFLALLYTLLAYFILHTQEFRIQYGDLWKVALYAALPSMMLFAVIPILRLGLPLAIIFGLQFVLWLVLAMLGTALFAEKHTGKFSPK